MDAKVDIPPKLIPLFLGDVDYRCSYGGRGSGKTRTFALMTAIRAYMLAMEGKTGIVLCGREFMNSLEDSSFAEVRGAIQSYDWLEDFFEIGEKFIRTKCGRISYSFQGLRRNIDSIKSKSRILILWIDEAESVSEECWRKVAPTVREEGSEIWVTWNPERKGSATDARFKVNPPNSSKVVSMNWRDNPFFTSRLERERQEDLQKRPDTYEHIWEGAYLESKAGAYFTDNILKAKSDSRWLVDVPEDPLLTVRLYADIGGTGARADSFVFWAVQISGQKINFINHYEAQGQPIGHHLDWMRASGYTPERAQIWLPHDGSTADKVFDVSYESAFRKSGYHVEVVPNQGKGAVKQRIEQMRNHFARMWFDKRCEAGCDALAWYHEKVDENRSIGLGPNHDWASHSADAAGMVAVTYKDPKKKRKQVIPRINIA